jgi:transcriptional regulator with XRE-family HTH domain
MEGDLQRVFGMNFRARREQLNMSQEAYAHELGRNRTYIGSIERGERNLRLKTVERLAELVGAEPLQLLGLDGSQPAPPLAQPSRRRRRRSTGEAG